MYRRLTNPELHCCASYRGLILYDVKSQGAGSVFDITLQTATLPNCSMAVYARERGYYVKFWAKRWAMVAVLTHRGLGVNGAKGTDVKL